MNYEGPIFRPPSESGSVLLQVTTGCSHNKCTFCSMYQGVRFSMKSEETVMADIDFAARHCRRQQRVFLCDGDALILPQKRLVAILTAIRERLPWVVRVGTYASPRSIELKSPDELRHLRNLGLGIAYLGLESGDDRTLEQIGKGADSARLIMLGQKIRSAGIALSITVLLGIAEPGRSQIHAEETGRVLSTIDPEYVGALTLMLTPGSTLYDRWQEGSWRQPETDELLIELGMMIARTNLTDGLFHANHASNYLPIKARLPQDKTSTLTLIERALQGQVRLRPEAYRAL
ncbi:MAG: radical SAM protein [Desulfofustis sp.]|nr:radical SAM protein [Desulfofustis sp.]